MKHLAELAAKLAAMTEAQRAAVADRYPVVTVEGRTISVRNMCLCAMQSAAPVTMIGGFKQWLTAGRCVRKGERAIYILHPCMTKGEDGEESVAYFREVPVFDVSQTDALQVAQELEVA